MDYDHETAAKLCRRFGPNGPVHNICVAFDFAFIADRRTIDLRIDCAAIQIDQGSFAANVSDAALRLVRLWRVDEARQHPSASRQLDASHFLYVVDIHHDSDIFLHGQFDCVSDSVEIHVANQKG